MFRDVCRFWRVQSKCPNKLRRSTSDKEPISPDTVPMQCSTVISPSGLAPSLNRATTTIGRRWTEIEVEEEDETDNKDSPGESAPFRERASTDGNLFQRPWRWRYSPAPSSANSSQGFYPAARTERRMSISMRGNNASY